MTGGHFLVTLGGGARSRCSCGWTGLTNDALDHVRGVPLPADDPPMLADELDALIIAAGLTNGAVAALLGVDFESVRRWRRGTYSQVPPALARWLREFFAWRAAHPVPPPPQLQETYP